LNSLELSLGSTQVSSDSNKFPKLCLDCQKRYQTNPLRILDCKICSLTHLPSYTEIFKKEDADYQKELREILDRLEINHYYNEKLVRGLDYYTGIVFELLINNQQKPAVILGGGRYDQLFRQFKTRVENELNIDSPSAGFALGIDRLVDYFFSLGQQYLTENLNNSNPDILFLVLEKQAYFLVLQ
jgi:histidyl-tRNA synthetase